MMETLRFIHPPRPYAMDFGIRLWGETILLFFLIALPELGREKGTTEFTRTRRLKSGQQPRRGLGFSSQGVYNPWRGRIVLAEGDNLNRLFNFPFSSRSLREINNHPNVVEFITLNIRRENHMNTLSNTSILNAVVELLTEAYAGPPDPSRTWFIDNEPDSGVIGQISNLSAQEASKSVDGSGREGTTLASHIEHLRWSLASMNAAIRGEPLGSWSESWRLVEADGQKWDDLRNDLKVEFESLRQLLNTHPDVEEQYLPGLFALPAHAAYHLGTIRQMIERVRA
jgi:hypothetical protein